MAGLSKRQHRRITGALRLGGKALGIAVLAGFAFVTTRAAWGMYQKFTEASAAHETAQEELAALTQKQQQVEAAVAALSSERGLEAEIRSRFGVAWEGEGEIQIVRDEGKEEDVMVQHKSLWQRILNAFAIW